MTQNQLSLIALGVLIILVIILWMSSIQWKKHLLWMRSFLRKILNFLTTSPFFVSLVYPLIILLPGFFIKWTEKAGAWPKMICEPSAQFLKDHPNVSSFLESGWPIVIIVAGAVVAFLQRMISDKGELDEKDTMLLLNAFDNAVGTKMERFGIAAANARKNNQEKKSAAEIFKEISQPDLQIEALIEALHLVFQNEIKDASERQGLVVTLASMEGKHIREFEFFMPKDHGPKIPAAELRRKECCYSCALASKSIIIIEDIKKELGKTGDKRFHPGNSESSCNGSIICYPVNHRNLKTTPYIIGIKAAAPYVFSSSNRKRYENILEKFAKRISMEYSLKILKGTTL